MSHLSFPHLDNKLQKREKFHLKSQEILKRHEYFLDKSKEYAMETRGTLSSVSQMLLGLSSRLDSTRFQRVWREERERLENAFHAHVVAVRHSWVETMSMESPKAAPAAESLANKDLALVAKYISDCLALQGAANPNLVQANEAREKSVALLNMRVATFGSVRPTKAAREAFVARLREQKADLDGLLQDDEEDVAELESWLEGFVSRSVSSIDTDRLEETWVLDLDGTPRLFVDMQYADPRLQQQHRKDCLE
ncbi:hypothetical protein HDU91_000924 [Kappamyces sp. JEL0680]|nr:hypothetical protein HDU91_000924 [Kappamyces sp. JEL0680]